MDNVQFSFDHEMKMPENAVRSGKELSNPSIGKEKSGRSDNALTLTETRKLLATSSTPTNRKHFFLYFHQFGQDLSAARIRLLAKKSEQLGATVVGDYKKASHIVLSEKVKDLNQVAERLGVSTDTFTKTLISVSCRIGIFLIVSLLNSVGCFSFHGGKHTMRQTDMDNTSYI